MTEQTKDRTLLASAGVHQLMAAILAGVFSLLGVGLGVLVNQRMEAHFQEELHRQRIAALVAQRAQGRWIRAQSLIMTANSAKFDSRWDDYILDGVTSRSQDFLVMADGIQRYFPHLEPDFDLLQDSFQQLNTALLPYSRSGGRPSKADQQKALEIKNAAGTKVRQVVETLLHEN